MKSSVFNVVVAPVEQTFIDAIIAGSSAAVSLIYNTFTRAFAQVDRHVQNALQTNDLTSLSDEEIRVLSDASFLVPDELDEFGDLERNHLADMNETDFLSLCIAPTVQCNLRCPYCYEEHENVRITPAVEDAIMRFIERRYEAHGFKQLRVLWYGGEPLLEIDAMERMSQRFIAWAEDHEVSYVGQIISNATLIDDVAAERLAQMNIQLAITTIDGCKSCNDTRRVHVDGRGSYDKIEAGVHALSKAGIKIGVSTNLDKTAAESFPELSQHFDALPHVTSFAAHLRTYDDWTHSEAAKKGNFDVLSREEFARLQFDLFAELNPHYLSIYETFRPRRSFCQGHMASYFVIDPEGNVCHCDGRMRDKEYVLFNVLDDDYEIDWPMTKTIVERNELCLDCALVPICLGQCDWEWSVFEENCTPAKYTIDDYLRLMYDQMPLSMKEEPFAATPSIRVLIEPNDMSTFYDSPLRETGLME